MSASKNRATSSVLKSERKSFLRFLALYIAMVLLLIVVISAFYYETQKKLMLSNQRATMAKYAYIQTKRLKVLHHFFDEQRTYPRDPRFKSAIYDIEYKKIFSLLDDPHIRFDKEIYLSGSHIHLVKTLDEFYLGTRYLIIEIEDDGAWRQDIWSHIFVYGVAGFLFFMIFGLFLARMFVRPMKNSIMLLDRFIKDTTHELNTPLSAILANIEMMDTDVMVEKNRKKLNRINIAAKTVSTLYRDLTFLTLEQEKEESVERIDLKALIHDRAEYFSVLAESKKLTCELDLEEAYIDADRRKITRVVDNLISNAIKYNKRDGTVGIKLRPGYLEVWDTGIGIEKEKIPFMFDRYMRFNESEGGFGVGLSIVKMIVDEYKIKISVVSAKEGGTKMILKWKDKG